MSVLKLFKMNNFFGQYLRGDCFEKSLYSLYPCHQIMETKKQEGFSSTSIIKHHSIAGSAKTWGEQTRFYFWRYSVVVCHKLTHFNSQAFIFSFTWNCCRLGEAKKFSRNLGHFKYVTKETRYHVSNSEL